MKKIFLLMLALVVMLSLSAFAKEAKMAKAKSVSGWVSDDKCTAGGAKAGHEDCAKKCIEGGQKMVFVTDKDKKVLAVSNPEALKGHEGHHVKVSAHVNNADSSIHVESVKMLKAKAAKAAKTEAKTS